MECHRADWAAVFLLADEAVHVNHWAAPFPTAIQADVITGRFIVQRPDLVISFSPSVHVDRTG